MKIQRDFVRLVLPFAAIFLSQARAQDIEVMVVSKFQSYQQVDSEVAWLLDDENGDDPLGFEAFVVVAPAGSVSSATITPSGKSAIPLIEDGDEWIYEYSTELLPELDTAYPSSTDYQFDLQTGSGPLAITLTLSADAYPNIPHVSNFSSAQSVNPAANFTLTWDAFNGGTVDDLIMLDIEDATGSTVFEAGGPGSGIDGTDTSLVIPAGRLSSGTTYSAELTFIKVVDSESLTDGFAAAIFSKSTNFELRTTGTSGETEAPWVSHHVPYNNQPDIPVESVVSFEFNEPMTAFANIDWSGDGLTPASFSYVWSNDGTRLHAIYGEPGGLPQGTQINWQLNPGGGGGTMQDLAGNALPSTSGSFTTLNAAASGENDASEIALVKFQSLMQTGATPQSADWYSLEAYVESNLPNAVTGATVTTPATPSGSFELASFWLEGSPEREAGFTSKTELDHYFPSGSYDVSINTAHDGPKAFSLSMPAGAGNYPNDPTVSNIASMSAVDADQPLTITWDPFLGADESGAYHIALYIVNERDYDVYESAGSGEIGGLTGTSTSVTIPAGTLSPGRSYEAELEFIRVFDIDSTTYPGTNAVTALGKVTLFAIQTTGAQRDPQASISWGGGNATILIDGDPYIEYRLDGSSDLSTWHQIQYPTFTDQDGQASIFDWDVTYFPHRFYRAVEISEDDWNTPPVTIQGMVKVDGTNTPIQGAMVGTSLDSETTITDASGRFFLQTNTHIQNGQAYAVQISRSGYQPLDQTQNWGDQPRGQEFSLQPE